MNKFKKSEGLKMNFKRREPVLVLIFSIITCGIYYLYWIYQTTDELGAYLQNDNNPVLDLLLCMFCAPYQIYWMYKISRQAAEAQEKAGNTRITDNAVLNLILTIFGLGIVASMILQSSINEVNG